jgi:hypothetical protein
MMAEMPQEPQTRENEKSHESASSRDSSLLHADQAATGLLPNIIDMDPQPPGRESVTRQRSRELNPNDSESSDGAFIPNTERVPHQCQSELTLEEEEEGKEMKEGALDSTPRSETHQTVATADTTANLYSHTDEDSPAEPQQLRPEPDAVLGVEEGLPGDEAVDPRAEGVKTPSEGGNAGFLGTATDPGEAEGESRSGEMEGVGETTRIQDTRAGGGADAMAPLGETQMVEDPEDALGVATALSVELTAENVALQAALRQVCLPAIPSPDQVFEIKVAPPPPNHQRLQDIYLRNAAPLPAGPKGG